MRQIKILDTTLRDGAQAEGVSFSLEDKIKLIRALDELGVDYIEAGNPVPVILGIVINSHLFKPLQPSMDAASYSSCGMDCIPAKFMSIL